MQKTSELLQGVADLYDDHVRERVSRILGRCVLTTVPAFCFVGTENAIGYA